VLQPRTNIHAVVDANFRTTVKGLYAILRQLLPRSSVGGMVAGETATENTRGAGLSDLEKHRNRIYQIKERYEGILNREGPVYADWREAQWAIYQIMHCYALPPHRTESTLTAGYHHLLRLRKLAQRILKASNQHDLYHCLEILNLMDIAELVLLAVKERKESRGQARRQDYPFTNPLLNKFLVISQKEGKPAFRWEKPRRFSVEV